MRRRLPAEGSLSGCVAIAAAGDDLGVLRSGPRCGLTRAGADRAHPSCPLEEMVPSVCAQSRLEGFLSACDTSLDRQDWGETPRAWRWQLCLCHEAPYTSRDA